MATVAAPRRRTLPRLDRRFLATWFEQLPTWLSTGGILLVLLAISAYLRTRYIGGQFWMDEAITTGIALAPAVADPGRAPPRRLAAAVTTCCCTSGSSAFGNSEAATHSLSLLFGLLTIPVGMWAGWSLFGRRAGLMAAMLFAFSAFLTAYAQETRMYELMGLLGLLATDRLHPRRSSTGGAST